MGHSDKVKRIVVAGGSGFLGRGLTRQLLANGYAVTVLSRRHYECDGVDCVEWDGRGLGEWMSSIDGAEALVNLAGRSVDCVKTPDHCDEILRSRVDSTRVLGEAVSSAETPPGVWIQMSTSHYYGDPPHTICTENSSAGYGLAPFVAKEWERAHSETCPARVRSVVLRTSFVIGRGGGALRRLEFLSRAGLGGRVGSGEQGLSWIHEEDFQGLILRCIMNRAMRGVYIASAPNPVSNAEFMRTLRGVLGVPLGLPAAEWMVRIGAPLFMKTDPELALYGRYCVSQRLAEEGFEFMFPTLDGALRGIFGTSGHPESTLKKP